MQDLRQKLWKYVVVRPPTSCDTLSLSSVKSSVKSSSIIIITNVIIVMMATNIVCSAGFKHGDSVALFMENRPEYIGVHFIINIIIIITSSSSSSFCFLFLHLPPPKKIRLSGHFLRFTFRVAYQIPISNTSCLSDLHDRVVIMMMQVWLGCSKIGAVPALINFNLRGQSLLHRLRREAILNLHFFEHCLPTLELFQHLWTFSR